MSRPHHSPQSPLQQPAVLAHELANLLDGSMRHVRLMMSELRDTSDNAPAVGDDDLVHRLQTVNQAMLQMATLLQKWMAQGKTSKSLAPGGHTLGSCVVQVTALLGEAASARRITIETDLSAEAAAQPAESIYPVLANALRNAVEAIADDPRRPADHRGLIVVKGRVEGPHLVLTVHDNGPGVTPALLDERGRLRIGLTSKPHGHGIGLSLSESIARNLGGTLELTNDPSGGGAVLTFRCPLVSHA